MFLYTVLEALFGVIAGILLAVCTKKSKDITYTSLDKVGRITNVLLSIVYVCLAPFYFFLGMISNPQYDGFLGLIGWIVAVIMASAAMFCWIGIGGSIALRKKGKSRLSFAAQFLGVVGIGLTVAFYFIFTGNLLKYLN
jgi:uncharacterized membrane protein